MYNKLKSILGHFKALIKKAMYYPKCYGSHTDCYGRPCKNKIHCKYSLGCALEERERNKYNKYGI